MFKIEITENGKTRDYNTGYGPELFVTAEEANDVADNLRAGYAFDGEPPLVQVLPENTVTTYYDNRTVNQTGLNEIAEFLAAHHKLGRDHFSDDMLRAWAADAEFQISEGNDATIEIKSWDSISGHTETFRVSDAGIDSEIIEIDE